MRRLFLIGCAATGVSAALVAVAIAVSVTLALIILCGILWLTLWRVLRSLQLERGATRNHTDQLRSQYDPIISALSSALGLEDDVTVAHARRVSGLAAAVASQMGLRPEEVRLIEKAAILHDIGKIGIAQEVLTQTGTLSEQEWAQMKKHPKFGYEIFRQIESLKDIAEIVYAHHERYDGQGYPRGLKGEDSPIGARIFSVVDAYVAMTSSRPYRKKMTHEIAANELVRNSLTQFDPQVVRAFLEADESSRLNDALLGETPAAEPSENGRRAALPSEA